MKSIKPGRGPSFMGGIASIASGLFGVFWTIMAVGLGAWFMAPFGLIFIGLDIANAVYNFKNATGANRYSAYDILDLTEADLAVRLLRPCEGTGNIGANAVVGHYKLIVPGGKA